jgi:hypothetical protein
MRHILIIVAVLAALVFPIGAQQSITPTSTTWDAALRGDNLIDACRLIADGTAPTADKSFQAGICLGELAALNWGAPGVYDENLRSCVPTSVTRQELAKVLVDYLDQNRDRLREPFEGLALEALAHAWHCPEPRGWFQRWFRRWLD